MVSRVAVSLGGEMTGETACTQASYEGERRKVEEGGKGMKDAKRSVCVCV